MSISGEWSLLEKIDRLVSQKQPKEFPGLVKGIGDDAAVFSLGHDSYGLISTDISIASAHFDTRLSAPEDIGYRAIISNISDINAMGGTGRYAFIAIGIPDNFEDPYIESLYEGILEGAQEGKVAIAGGDISRAAELTISIAIYGDISGREPVYRSGASTGDTIYCTGTLGGSRAGLELLLEKKEKKKPQYLELIKRHNRPPCRREIVEEILQVYTPSAMIDISDGLLADLGHICRAGNVGASIDIEMIPPHEGTGDYALHEKRDLKELLLKSGEEYELLFASPVAKRKELISGIPVSPVGTITSGGIVIREKGKSIPVSPGGFDHFNQRGTK